MQKDTLEYIQNRAAQSDTASIKAVSCPDIRALLAERAALIAALENILNVSVWDGETRDDDEFFVTGKALAQCRAAIAKAAK